MSSIQSHPSPYCCFSPNILPSFHHHSLLLSHAVLDTCWDCRMKSIFHPPSRTLLWLISTSFLLLLPLKTATHLSLGTSVRELPPYFPSPPLHSSSSSSINRFSFRPDHRTYRAPPKPDEPVTFCVSAPKMNGGYSSAPSHQTDVFTQRQAFNDKEVPYLSSLPTVFLFVCHSYRSCV